MKTWIFLLMVVVVATYLIAFLRRKPSRHLGSIDAIVPAYNEEPCITQSLECLLRNPYLDKVICVNDGSTDGTARVLEQLAQRWGDKLVVVNQANTGKGGALMNGLRHATAAQVFLTDADTHVPPDSDGLGYMLAEIERGADAVGGIPSSNLRGAGFLPHVRATIKLPMIIVKRTFQQIVGGAPFIISGACGLFRTDVLRKTGFSDRTRVEDLDLTWTLVGQGYRVRQANRCVVFPQECNTVGDEWRRWRRWIVGYAVCMRLHRHMLLTRYGLGSILPMALVVFYGVYAYLLSWLGMYFASANATAFGLSFFPLIWVGVVTLIGGVSAVYHRSWSLMPLASLAVLYVLFAYTIWMLHGLPGLITGREPKRDKPRRYANVVD